MSQRPEYKKFKQGDNCEEEGCRSRYFYVQDGRAFCKSHDHIQNNWRQVEQDEDDFNSQGKKTRTQRVEREKVVRVLAGKESRDLFLHCWQLILWKQLAWLTRSKEEGGADLPQELEGVVRGLWAVKVRTLVVEDPIEEGGFSSQSDFESGEDTSGTETTGFSTREKKWKKLGLRLIETLGLCYLGTVLMKLPISIGEFHQWAEKEDIIYIRAIRYVPREMKSKLHSHYHAALDTRSPLKPDSLHKCVLKLVTSLNDAVGISFPALNHRVLAFNHVRSLGLPLEIYLATQRLVSLLSIDFTFPSPSTSRFYTHISPDIQLISLIMVATKLAHPFEEDLQRKKPTSLKDPAILNLDWNFWTSVVKSEDRGVKKAKGLGGLVKGKEIEVKEEDAFRFNGKELDDYLEWYQKTFLDGTDEEQKIPSQLLRQFPVLGSHLLTNSQSHDPHDPQLPHHPPPKIKAIQKSLKYQQPTSPPEAEKSDDEAQSQSSCKAGNRYIRYRKESELPQNAKAFFDVVSKQTSISLQTLILAVFKTEQRLVDLMVAKRRRELDLGSEISDHEGEADLYDLDE